MYLRPERRLIWSLILFWYRVSHSEFFCPYLSYRYYSNNHVDTPTRDSSGHYIDGIVTTEDEFTKDNKKRPGRYRIIQQREGEVNGRDKVKSSLGKARELKEKIGSNEMPPPGHPYVGPSVDAEALKSWISVCLHSGGLQLCMKFWVSMQCLQDSLPDLYHEILLNTCDHTSYLWHTFS